jgi:hypothetical protein
MNGPGPRPLLDADLEAALTRGQQPAAGDDAVLGRVRARLLKSIAAESVPHHTAVHADEARWKPFLPGIERKVLHVQDGVMSYLLKFAPGAVLPAHRHPVDEECVVISGVLRIGPLALPAGSYHRVRSGVLDADSSSDEGAVVFLRGATPHPEQLV